MYYYDPKSFHIFKKRDCYFLFAVNDISIFEISELCYKILSRPGQITEIELEKLKNDYDPIELEEVLLELLEWNIIYSKSRAACIFPPTQNSFMDENSDKYWLNGLYLVVAQDCNLRCKYCSAEYGKFGQEKVKSSMSNETIDKVIDFLIPRIRKDNTQVSIIFVGGEPLLNFPAIKYFYESWDKRKIPIKLKIALNTNGTLVTEEIAQWFFERDIPLRFSIDGSKQLHDTNRLFIDGKGSYDHTINGLKNYMKYQKNNISVQSSIPHGKDLYNHVRSIWDLGVNFVLPNPTGQSFFLETDEIEFSEEDYDECLKNFDRLSEDVATDLIKDNRTYRTYSYLFGNLKALHTKRLITPGCGVGRTVAITTDEKIWLCQGFVGLSEYCIGDLKTGPEFNKIQEFGDKFAKYLDRCNSCWSRNLCGSACIAMSAQYKELDEDFPPSRRCDFHMKMLENSIYIYNTLLNENAESLSNFAEKKK